MPQAHICAQVKRIRYATWLKRYKPIMNTLVENAPYDGLMYETYDRELQVVRAARNDCVWTLLDTGGRYSTITNGFHYVNRIGYFITEEPCVDGFVEINV